jgi:hypothetical protein
MVSETFKQIVEETNLIEQTPLNDYLSKSLEGNKDNLCKGWDFLKTNLTTNLKEILLNPKYQEIVYNSDNVKFILDEIGISLNEELKNQLGSFVYVWKDIKRDCEKLEEENNLRNKLLKDGFIEQRCYSNNEEENKTIREQLKLLNELKVICVFDRDKIGLLGSFEIKEEHKGKLIFIDSETKFNKICFMPKGHTKTGQILINNFYYKEVKKIKLN